MMKRILELMEPLTEEEEEVVICRNSVADSLDNFIRDLRNSSTKLSQQKLIELSQNLSFANSDYKLTIDGLKMQSTESDELKYTTIGTPVSVFMDITNGKSFSS